MRRTNLSIPLFLSLLLLFSCGGEKKLPIPTDPQGDPDFQYDYTGWSDYLGDPGRSHYTILSQITPDNVDQLEIAWSYAAPDSGQMQMNPVIANGMLYGVTAGLRIFALDAATGKEIWSFGESDKAWHSTSRGVAYWEEGADKRILCTRGSFLFCLDAMTGEPIPSFGEGGKVDLHTGLPEAAREKFIISGTPGTLYEDLIIMPVRLSEGPDAAPGDIRAFNVRTGELVWTFHTIPHPGEPGYETWSDPDTYKNEGWVGGANNWAGMALDPRLGIVYVPTGSAAPDFYGGDRLGANLYANCLLALNARTGERIWHFQFVHHDIWDRDAPAPPNLLTVERNGKKVEAVAQITKQGYVLLFDRRTGEPLFEIEEKPFPPSTLAGEEAWATQPVPVKPKPFARYADKLTEDDLSPYAENKDELLEIFRKADKRIYAPPSTDPVLLLPGYDGAGEWGGAGADPDAGILYVNANEMPWILQMEKTVPGGEQMTKGESLYATYCLSCHQMDLKGLPQSGYPSLEGLAERLKKEEVAALITNGRNMMTGFPLLDADQKNAIIAFLYQEEKQEVGGDGDTYPLPYRHTGYNKFLDSKGLPAISPPWGTLHAIDLNTGEFRWSITLGDTESLRAQGHPPTGCESYGGPIITENGLLLIAGTKDGCFRAFDKYTGNLLWETKLPAAAFATPATYEINGKQYVALACGGEKLGTPKGHWIVAFALGGEALE
jgi:quinoprotein glucose dehydrogenase